ncbi:Hypothetical protein PHPALM_12332 [Phytophthora palmivora]|uniref:Uncharacterized protein n=1 Tax=Phytophthora palmivora TaxID=4796 RepID=A0A2P4Y011_9STRA|nr:Hypothetical protein PHPALM_12332 [Phytophthora palmivora]
MSKSRSRQPLNYGKAHFQVDASDLLAARELGILREDVDIDCSDFSSPSYGVVYALRENIASSEFSSQKAVHSKCKDFAIKCGFQIFVKQTSMKGNNSGKTKFACKNLNGMQFFDHESAPEQLSCSFFINVHGKLGKWKITQANFAHNHLKLIGTSTAQCVEGSIPLPAKAKRNTTQIASKLMAMIEGEILPVHNGSTTTMTGTAIKKFLKSKGADVSASVVFRMKQAIDEKLHGDKRQLAGNWVKKSGEEGLVPKLLKTRNDRTIPAGMGLTACSISARLQFLDMFIHTELWFFLTELAHVSTGKMKTFPVSTQSAHLSTKD